MHSCRGWVVGLLWASMTVLSACVEVAVADTPPDAGTAPAKAQRKRDDAGVIGLGGYSTRYSEPECMAPAVAMRRAQQPQQDPNPLTRERKIAIDQNADFPECPDAIWTWVGAGHGATPVGNVTAPFTAPQTRKARRKGRHSCCYLIPSAPGSPAG